MRYCYRPFLVDPHFIVINPGFGLHQMRKPHIMDYGDLLHEIHATRQYFCSTESDLSWDDDELTINTKVSFTEFIQQYKELTDWLTTIQVVTQRQGMTSLSEKYLNQSYHEEMLQRSPRRKLFNDYAKQLMRRFPNMKEEINSRLRHLNEQWVLLENAISPQDGADEETMLRDLELDLNDLRRWLHGVENTLLPLCIRQSWTQEMLEDKLKEHQALQRDIESHSKIVSAVLKLCERLHSEKQDCQKGSSNECEGLRIIAINLERRWHAIWLQSLEWQCRLEEAINKRKNPNISPNSTGGWEVQYNSAIPFSISPDHVHGIDDSDQSTDFFDEDGDLEFGHNSDVLPFSEDEYEKFALDVHCQTEIFDNPETLVEKEIVDDVELTPDELSKTVYIQEADGNGLKMWSSSERVTKSSSSSPTADLDAAKDSMEVDDVQCKMEVTDVGYGSESHSNDEPDSGEKAEAGGCQTSASQTEVVDVTTSEVQTQEVVFRNRVVLSDGGLTSASGSLQTVLSCPTWRDSMTSAYDTSSNCSDHPSHDVVGNHSCRPTSLCIPDDDTLLEFKSINASPGEKFYKVTALDDYPGQGVENAKKSLFEVVSEPPRDEAVVIAIAEDVPEATDLMCKPVNGVIRSDPSLTKNRADILWTEIEHLEENETQKQSKLLTTLENNDLDVRSSYTAEWTERTNKWSGAFTALIESTETNSEMISQLQQKELSHGSLSERRTASRDSIRRLVSQAESLVKDDDYNTQRPKWRDRKQRRRRKPKLAVSYSLTSDASMPENSADSCDASGETTTESEGEYSSALSDTEYKINSILSVPEESSAHDTTGSTLKNSSYTATQLTSPEWEGVKLRPGHKRKFERPRSVTEMYELSNRLDLSPFSISEGSVVTCRHPNSGIPVQTLDTYHTSESASSLLNSRCNTLPRTQKPKFRKMKRSRSESEHLSSAPMTHHYHSFSKENSPSRFSREGSCSTERILSNNSSSERTVGYSADNLYVSSSTEYQEQKIAGESGDGLGQPLYEYDLTGIAAEYVQTVGNISEETDDNLNSTIESFSENAWDNYQDPYPTVSEDGNEEKLDDSHLQWEASTLSSTFEFDDDFQLSDRKKKSSGYLADTSRVDDSDSDLDDLLHILEQSLQQLQVAQSMLTCHRKDAMDTGIYLQPQRYAEILATCQTNIKCLQTIIQTLVETDGSLCVGDDDFLTVQNTIDQWTLHRNIAIQRQEQSKQLCQLYQEMVAVKNCLDDTEDLMDVNQYPDHFSLEQIIKILQDKKLDLHQQRAKLEALKENIQVFSTTYPDVRMDRFQVEILNLTANGAKVSDQLSVRFSEFQSLLICWYDYNETHKELSYFLSKERQLLQCLEMTLSIMEFTTEQRRAVVRDLKGMLKDFNMYEQKLTAMRRLSNEVLSICDKEKQLEIRAEVAMASNELAELRKRSQDTMTKCIEHCGDLPLDIGIDDDTDSGIGIHRRTESMMGIETIGAASVSTETEVFATAAATQTPYDIERGEPVKAKKEEYSLMKLLVRMALPFQLAILVLYGILCFFDRDGQPGLLSFSPTLRYVRGPPPT
ncbi:uncharacterized protein LOC135485513 isoform X2 [Lineus longissimus]|uniref:uncharacterized protein LOC135485513 isoform X2 n=1 Tax=Lineus longissimus TaxID=88925 RepID=UPI002B4F3951